MSFHLYLLMDFGLFCTLPHFLTLDSLSPVASSILSFAFMPSESILLIIGLRPSFRLLACIDVPSIGDVGAGNISFDARPFFIFNSKNLDSNAADFLSICFILLRTACVIFMDIPYCIKISGTD